MNKEGNRRPLSEIMAENKKLKKENETLKSEVTRLTKALEYWKERSGKAEKNEW